MQIYTFVITYFDSRLDWIRLVIGVHSMVGLFYTSICLNLHGYIKGKLQNIKYQFIKSHQGSPRVIMSTHYWLLTRIQKNLTFSKHTLDKMRQNPSKNSHLCSLALVWLHSNRKWQHKHFFSCFTQRFSSRRTDWLRLYFCLSV